ncbi:MAG: ATP-dependent Clp protease proteolytic subunit, partial [Candidatus Blochmannia sp. A2]|nr:ATP-dependent Clp protease proteolytic subunit [Candidatus Blochmannia sp. A2]
DTMQFVKPDINTICIGQACSMGAFILTAGTKGKRSCLPHSKIMIHQPLGGYQGQASDIAIHSREIIKTKKMLNKLMSIHTNQPIKKINKDTDRDCFLSAQEAVKYGIVDFILNNH